MPEFESVGAIAGLLRGGQAPAALDRLLKVRHSAVYCCVVLGQCCVVLCFLMLCSIYYMVLYGILYV
jgi:hypothetical protein